MGCLQQLCVSKALNPVVLCTPKAHNVLRTAFSGAMLNTTGASTCQIHFRKEKKCFEFKRGQTNNKTVSRIF